MKTRHAALTLCVLAPVVAFLWQQAAPAPAPPASRSRPAAKKTPPPAKPVPPPVPAPKPLANPPGIVKAVYFTEYSAGLRKRLDYLVDLRKSTEVNAVVIDTKDYSGNISYRAAVPAAVAAGAIHPTIRSIDAVVNRLHEEGMYVIARITCFQDPVLARARPELAVHRLSKLPKDKKPLTADSLWLDRKGLAWLDPSSRGAWEYIAALGKDALAHGFDELNFDYVRFPSDGNLKDMYFPNWNEKVPKHDVISRFFAHLRKQFDTVPISADLFGLATVNDDDLGIGQVIEDAYASFDYVCPMIYPSHYAKKFLGYANPAAHPYEVIDYSMKEALRRLEEFRKPAPQQPPRRAAKLRPWIQDFNLGAKYDAAMVRSEIQAVEDALGKDFAGYMVWAPSNVYTKDALKAPEPKPEAKPLAAEQQN